MIVAVLTGRIVIWTLQKSVFFTVQMVFYASLAGQNIHKTQIISRMRRDANIYDLLGNPAVVSSAKIEAEILFCSAVVSRANLP